MHQTFYQLGLALSVLDSTVYYIDKYNIQKSLLTPF